MTSITRACFFCDEIHIAFRFLTDPLAMVTVLTEISMVTFLSSIYVLLSVIKDLVSQFQ